MPLMHTRTIRKVFRWDCAKLVLTARHFFKVGATSVVGAGGIVQRLTV